MERFKTLANSLKLRLYTLFNREIYEKNLLQKEDSLRRQIKWNERDIAYCKAYLGCENPIDVGALGLGCLSRIFDTTEPSEDTVKSYIQEAQIKLEGLKAEFKKTQKLITPVMRERAHARGVRILYELKK